MRKRSKKRMKTKKKVMAEYTQKSMRSEVREVSPDWRNVNKMKRGRRRKLQRRLLRRRQTE